MSDATPVSALIRRSNRGTALAVLFSMATLAWTTLRQAPRQHFEEIDVERINIVEKDGKLRLVISNQARQHPGCVDGKPIPRDGARPPGLLFFDHRGDECGGLIFDENGGRGHFVSLTFDKARQDQTIGLQHLESDNGQYFAGLRIWDRTNTSLADTMAQLEAIKRMPESEASAAVKALQDKGELGTDRITVGKRRDKSAVIELADVSGRPRLRLAVDAAGKATLEFLGEDGKPVYTLPADGKR